MLRIHIGQDRDVTTFRLEGKLAGPWVAELDKCWQIHLLGGAVEPIIVDLAGITFVDDPGTELLKRMHRQGIKLTARGCLTMGLIERIKDEISKGGMA
jgi:hypothetical protein